MQLVVLGEYFLQLYFCFQGIFCIDVVLEIDDFVDMCVDVDGWNLKGFGEYQVCGFVFDFGKLYQFVDCVWYFVIKVVVEGFVSFFEVLSFGFVEVDGIDQFGDLSWCYVV